jgi:regulator of protease activity HflC (stomatin/prohibitin superfamily)
MRKLASISTIALLLVALVAFVGGLHWTINRVYVPEGESLQLRYKGPLIFGKRESAKTGYWAEEGQIGVLQRLRGPGRHFYCPIWWEREPVEDIVIVPGKVGIVTCKLGDSLPDGEFLVDGDIGNTKFKGVLRKALAPGRYRINPYGYSVTIVATQTKEDNGAKKHSGWVSIDTGYVGVVTNLTDNPITKQAKGIQPDILPPGIYPINGNEQEIDIVEIGFRESTLQYDKVRDPDGTVTHDESGEPLVVDNDSGISFPSSDGFTIQMDFTAIWGLMPEQAPHAVATFGNVKQVENKVVQPQIESICRNNGSKYKAVDLLVGEKREDFQATNLEEFRKVLLDKKITLQYGLVRHIYIPKEVREPIQSAFIADETSLTLEQEQFTAEAEGALREAEQQVDLATKTVDTETERKYEAALAEGDREARGIDAETAKQVAAINKLTAELKAQAKIVMATAENEGQQLIEEATADKFALAVEAFGGAEAYNNWIFASNLPDDIDLNLIYAGEGTLWTDSKTLALRANIPVNPPKATPKSTSK